MMTNTMPLTMTAAHLTIAAAESIIKQVADESDAKALAHYRAVSATIDGRVGAAIEKLGEIAATKMFNEQRASLATRKAAFRRKCR
jgi:hypothetical protein